MNNPLLYIVTFWIASSAIRAMPDPAPTGQSFYRWSFQFLHLLMANWDKVASAMPKLGMATAFIPPPSADPTVAPETKQGPA